LRKLRIGIEKKLIAGQMTGVGNYSFQLLKALICSAPQFEFIGFSPVGWTSFDSSSIRQIECRQNKKEVVAVPPLVHKLSSAARRSASRSTTARWLYRASQKAAFASTVGSQSLDLFHALSFIPPADPGVPTLPVVYDLSFVRYPQAHPHERLIWLKRLPKIIANAPLVQTISEFSRNEIVSVYGYPKDRIVVAPPAAARIFRPFGIDATRSGLAQFKLSPNAYLLAVGTLEPRKNLRTLVSAYARLSAAERSVTPLVVAGGVGWGNVGLPKQASELVRDGSLRFVGMVPDARLRDLYEGAVALFYPSLYEGFGMPVVEAMSCGTQVIHSEGTSMDEISGEFGLRLPPTDTDAWTRAIRKIIDKASSRQSGIATQQLIDQAGRFDWATSADKVKAAYMKLV
jgi:glycosyltransferase involved in cell wall biosynthesis